MSHTDERPEGADIGLPSWIDQAIAKSKAEPSAEESAPDTEPLGTPTSHEVPGVETASAPPATSDSAPSSQPAENAPVGEEPTPAFLPHEPAPSAPPSGETVVAQSSPPPDAQRAALPWVIAALFFTGAALVLAYFIWLRPPTE